VLWDDPLLGVASGLLSDQMASVLAAHWTALAISLDDALASGATGSGPLGRRVEFASRLARLCAIKARPRMAPIFDSER
jgi:hypothetical protein